jgi:pimeloyl-ACP methyl ester carboxylesterase
MRIQILAHLVLQSVLAVSVSACEAKQPVGPLGSIRTAGAVNTTAEAGENGPKPTIVLVHGAFADASGWTEVITRLQSRGYAVVAVQNPLTSLATDVATTRRVIDAQPGAVVVVGHSYGGAVITGASAGSSKVKALVFIAAFAPDANEPLGAVGAQFPPPALASAIVPDAAGFVYIDTAKFRDVFAGDVPQPQARVMAVTQKPLFGHIFAESSPDAGWKTIPSWYLVAQNDRAINPDSERFYAQRMNARTEEVASSHVPFLSRPEVVVKLIIDAATSITGGN